MRTIIATHCTLEPQVVGHAEEMFLVLSDPAIYAFENSPPISAAWLSERFARLESRTSGDGAEHWLNWVIRVPSGALAGYTQATVQANGYAYVAYELSSNFWRRGIGRDAVAAMLRELSARYDVHTFLAVLKARNHRSQALLNHLGFMQGPPANAPAIDLEHDEFVMHRYVGCGARAG